MVEQIISILNESLKGFTSDQDLYGLAQSVLRVVGSEKELLPCVVGKEGEGEYVGIDDIKSIIGYHKLNTVTSSILTNGRGDNHGDIINTFGMGFFLFWNRARFDKKPDELLMLVQSRWPVIIKGMPDIKIAKVKMGNINTNTLQIYNQEYQEANPKLPPNVSLMQVNYTIELTFNPDCLPGCP